MICRCCKIHFRDKGGCAICKDLRRSVHDFTHNVIWEEDEFDLDGLNEQILRMLKHEQNTIEKVQKQKSEKGNKFGDMENPARTRQVIELAKGQAVIMKEARALLKERKKRAENLSLEERCVVMVEFFKKIPPEYQRKLHQKLAQAYNEVLIGKKTA